MRQGTSMHAWQKHDKTDHDKNDASSAGRTWKIMTKFCHDFRHAVLSVSGAHVLGPFADLARINDMTQNMLEGSDHRSSFSPARKWDESGHGVANVGPFEDSHSDFQRCNFSEIKILTLFVRLGRPRAKVRNRCPYRRFGVDTEIPYRLFSLIFCRGESGETEFSPCFWSDPGSRCWISVSGSYRR